MVDSFDTSGGEIVAIKAGVEKFSTAKKQFNRVPLAQVSLTNYAVTFPNFNSLTYRYNYYTNIPNGSFPQREICMTEGVVSAQEWGPAPDYISPYLLADILIGPAPVGANYLDVQANISRTTTPYAADQYVVAAGSHQFGALPRYGYYDWPISFHQGEWLNLTDAALVVERWGGFLARLFWFEIVAGNIYLRRRMSVGAQCYTHLIDAKQNSPPLGNLSSGNVNGSGCSGVNHTDYTSVYTGNFIIIPCAC